MNEGIKALWLDALRSGEYPQGTALLRKPWASGNGKDKYCCLGVLCDLYIKSEENSADPQGPIGWEVHNPLAVILAYKVGGREAYLPLFVMDWAGLEDNEGGFVGSNGRWGSLAEMNDSGATFEEIAEVIEEKF